MAKRSVKETNTTVQQQENKQEKLKVPETVHHKETPYFSGPVAFLVCVAGIYASYFIFGVVQQLLNETTFGPDKIKFRNTSFLLFVQCVGNSLCAWIAIKVFRQPGEDKTPIIQYALIAASYVGAMFASNFAIQFISFPMKELAKACKPIPVLLIGVIVFGKKQPLLKYICVFLVTIGIYIYMSDEISHSESSSETSTYGIFLLVASLALDGITGPLQDRLEKEHHPSSQAMMFYTNMWASLYMGISIIVTGKGVEGVKQLYTHNEIIPYIVLFAVLSAVGQNFIYYTVKRFGSLVCSLITTTRKFFSIFISSVVFAKPLSGMEWFGVFIVFAGLGVDIYASAKKKRE